MLTEWCLNSVHASSRVARTENWSGKLLGRARPAPVDEVTKPASSIE